MQSKPLCLIGPHPVDPMAFSSSLAVVLYLLPNISVPPPSPSQLEIHSCTLYSHDVIFACPNLSCYLRQVLETKQALCVFHVTYTGSSFFKKRNN